MPSEVLPLQWSQVDFKAGTVRLDPGTTKNREGVSRAASPRLPAHRGPKLRATGHLISRSVAMKLTGHKTEAVYRRYAIVSEGALAEAARWLDSATGTIPGTIGVQTLESEAGGRSK